jgi:hypothetical protein
MTDVIEQDKTESNVKTIAKRLIDASKTQTLQTSNPCHAAMKSYRNATIPTSAPFDGEVSILRQRFTAKQATLCSFFECNPTPACADDTSDDDKIELVQVASSAKASPHVQD